MKIRELFFVLGIGLGVEKMMESELQICVELPCCCNIFEIGRASCRERV